MKTLILLFLSLNAYADQWFCTDEALMRSGDTVKACGIGEDAKESKARAKAYEAARVDFNEYCYNAGDCWGHYLAVEPLRTECIKGDEGYKCWRMFRVIIKPAQTTARKD